MGTISLVKKCSEFIKCAQAGNQLQVLPCAGGTLYHDVKKFCDWPSEPGQTCDPSLSKYNALFNLENKVFIFV